MTHALATGRRAAFILALALFAQPSLAQENGAEMWEKGNCGLCHGAFGQGGAGEAHVLQPAPAQGLGRRPRGHLVNPPAGVAQKVVGVCGAAHGPQTARVGVEVLGRGQAAGVVAGHRH